MGFQFILPACEPLVRCSHVGRPADGSQSCPAGGYERPCRQSSAAVVVTLNVKKVFDAGSQWTADENQRKSDVPQSGGNVADFVLEDDDRCVNVPAGQVLRQVLKPARIRQQEDGL